MTFSSPRDSSRLSSADLSTQPSNVVIIRNLPSNFNLENYNPSDEVKALAESLNVVAIKQEMEYDSYHFTLYPVVRVAVQTAADAKLLVENITGREFQGKYLIASVGSMKIEHHWNSRRHSSPSLTSPFIDFHRTPTWLDKYRVFDYF